MITLGADREVNIEKTKKDLRKMNKPTCHHYADYLEDRTDAFCHCGLCYSSFSEFYFLNEDTDETEKE